MAAISSEPNQIQVLDVAFGAANSEALFTKMGGTSNYVLDNFDIYPFGISGGVYSGFSIYPYTFPGSLEVMRAGCVITNILIYNEETGSAGTTTWRLERQLAAGGSWDNLFSSDPTISSSAADGVNFKYTDVSYPAGTTLPTLAITSLAAGDKVRFVLVAAATDASNLKIRLVTRPV